MKNDLEGHHLTPEIMGILMQHAIHAHSGPITVIGYTWDRGRFLMWYNTQDHSTHAAIYKE